MSEFVANPAGKLVGNTVSDYVIPNLWGRAANAVGWVTGGLAATPDQPRLGPLTGRGFGTFGEVYATKDSGSNPPNVTNDGWEALRIRRRPSGESYYVRGHLINQHLGGPGGSWNNLAPITDKTNHEHSHRVEQAVKLQAFGGGVHYRVQAVYGRSPWSWPDQVLGLVSKTAVAGIASLAPASSARVRALTRLRDIEQHIPVSFQCDWWLADGTHGQASIRQVPNDGAGFWVDLGAGQVHDLSRAQAMISLLDAGLNIALKAWLWPSVVPVLGTAKGQAILALLNARPRAALDGANVVSILGHYLGVRATFGLLSGVGFEIPAFWPRVGPAGMLQVVSELTGLPSVRGALDSVAGMISPGDQTPVNRDEREAKGSLTDEHRARYLRIKDDPGAPADRVTTHPRSGRGQHIARYDPSKGY